MKKSILFILLCGCTQMLHATDTNQTGNKRIDPFYLQLFGGINKSANEHLPWSEFSSYPWSMGAFFGVGKEFTPLWGWRGVLRYNHNKGRNVEECESKDTYGWDNIGVFGDITFDLTDAFSSKASTQAPIFNLKAFVGIGAAFTFGFDDVPLSYTHPYSNENNTSFAGRLGLTGTFRVAEHWRIGAELSQTFFMDKFNGVKADCPLDGRTNLSLGVTYLLGRNEEMSAPAEPVVYDNRLRFVPDLPFVMPNPESVKKRTITGRAFLDFQVNETTINPNYRRNPQELRRIYATIDSALFDKSIQITGISLHGYASPESPVSNNERLAKGRAASLMGYLQRRYQVSASLFHDEATPEDWVNLREFVASSNRRRVKGDIWYENASILDTPEAPEVILKNRDELLRVIDMNIDADEKEEKLKQVGNGEPYKWLLKNVYPGLRHTDYVISYIVQHYPVKQSRKLIYTHPEALSVEEMYRVAQSYEVGSDDWMDALLIAAKQYPNDKTANLNAACACVKAKRLSDAKAFLKEAGNSEQARYLADVIQAMEGNCKWKLENGKVVVVDSNNK